MMNKYIALPEDFCIKIERAHYEYNIMTENIAFLIDQHKNNPDFYDSPLFQKYQDKQITKKIEYDAVKNEVNNYLPPEFQSDKFMWTMDFSNRRLIITGV